MAAFILRHHQMPLQILEASIPGFGGEADIFQSLQYLPGIRSAVEGTTGLSVRGGSFDQTLIQLDEAPVYNPSHALGFFSTFKPDAIKSIDVYKGLVPSQHCGRLSSVVDLKMRYAAFALIGPGIAYHYDAKTGKVADATAYPKNKLINFRSGLEPRISANYSLPENGVLSLVYNRSIQYLHLLSNSSVGLPTDVWFPTNQNVSPQSSSLFSMGYKKAVGEYVASLATYYKQMDGVIDFVDNADFFVNLVSAYKLSNQISLSLDFQYNSGGAVSLPVAVYEYQSSTFNYYESRNGYRLPAFHRLDMQISFSKKRKWGERQWVIGLYNAYNKRNLFSVEVTPADYNWFQFSNISAISLYGIVPSVAYNFKF